MRTLVISAFVLAATTALGCTQRVMVQPRYVSEQTEYVYFVEQVDGRDSRIKKCDIAPDTSARCSVQFDLKQ